MSRACSSRLRTLASVRGSRYFWCSMAEEALCSEDSASRLDGARGCPSLFFRGVAGDQVGEAADDLVGLDVLRLGVEVRDDPVPQHRRRHRADVLAGDVV